MRRTYVAVLPLLIVLALAIWRGRGPEPKPDQAPAREFSAARSLKTLQSVLGDDGPHPLGTRANQRVLARAVTQFRVLGYETEVQRRFACNASAACGMVENLIARQPGAARRDAVLLAAHYDSVGAGAGASDDGAGVATMLEVARALKGQRFRNPVSFLITDGEELGLLGAEAFVADEALAAEAGAVISVEMRGTYGPSNMFETSTGNRWLIRHLANALERPQATSLYFAIYQRLPNDTDVTIFKRAGMAAVNFAAVRGVNWYHTRLDDVAHVNLRTLQHHGDNALGTARVLADADLRARSRTDATYFDVLGYHLIWWPGEWTLWIAIVSLILLVFAARKSAPRQMTFGVLTAFATILASAAAGVAIAMLTRVRTSDILFVARPTPSVAAMWITGIAAALLAATLFRKRAEPLEMLYGVAMVWHMIGIGIALTLPGAAFLFVVPAVAVTLCALARADEKPTSIIASTVAAVLIFPMALIFYDTLGGPMMAVVAVLIAMLMTFVAPLMSGAWNTGAMFLLALGAGVYAMLQPGYDAERPQPISITYLDDQAARGPVWSVLDRTPAMDRVAQFTASGAALTPWSPGNRPWTAPAPPARLQRATVTATRNGNRMTLRVRSSRGANRITLLMNGDVKVVTVNGVAPAPRPARFRERPRGSWTFASANGVNEMTVVCTARGSVEVVASEMTYGLPGSGLRLQEARDASPAVPIQDGDVTITRTRARF